MPKKYRIDFKPTPLELDLIAKFRIERGELCINCGKCVKVCIYEAHKRREDDPRKMADPIHKLCKNCFRCIQECLRGALTKSIMPEFKTLGDAYWKPDMILSLWKQAEDGKVPVSGAGYRGVFTGPGFDSMWTDMSEIVRPTRDGIHGREYISTSVDLGRKLGYLEFDKEKRLLSEVHPTVDIPIPIIFDTTMYDSAEIVKSSIVRSAERIHTLSIFNINEIDGDIKNYTDHIIPLLSHQAIEEHSEIIKQSKIIEIVFSEELVNNFQEIRHTIKKVTDAMVVIRIPASKDIEETVLTLAKNGAEVIHIVADHQGMEMANENPRFIKEVLHAVHDTLTEHAIRDEVTLISSGGIAMAEHVPKSLISGADLVAIDIPLILALGYELHDSAENMLVPPVNLSKISREDCTQRIVNLLSAWHSQILEVLGAMGIREVRRLRGERGRAIFFDIIDGETFGKIFGYTK